MTKTTTLTDVPDLSVYAAKELQRMAVRSVRDDAKAMGTRAKFISWSLVVRNDSTVLVAYGETRARMPRQHAHAFSVRTIL